MVESSVRRLLGKRSPRHTIDPDAVIASAEGTLEKLRNVEPEILPGIAAAKAKYALDARVYYTAAAVSRRRALDEERRFRLYALLFELRSRLERAFTSELSRISDQASVFKSAASRSFFGVSAKQGVSIRYALLTCVPTRTCGGRCYAHDGRDRELHLLFRGVLNAYLGHKFEVGDALAQRVVDTNLRKSVAYGGKAALADAEHAAAEGYIREPRIRFSHVGEMAATPRFANHVAGMIREYDPRIRCVVYTRHPNAAELDPNLFVVNFTLEGKDDPRGRFAPPTARIVSSAWDGIVWPGAEINFLEHHVEKVSSQIGAGHVCPVTLAHADINSCDSARCDRCFREKLS